MSCLLTWSLCLDSIQGVFFYSLFCVCSLCDISFCSFLFLASTSNIIETMNNISLDDEEDDGLILEGIAGETFLESIKDFNAELCLVGRFLIEGVVDFPAMQQTMAALWRPGKGVFIKEVDVNLYLFQFYHEVDIRRVMNGSHWSLNRKALVIARMRE